MKLKITGHTKERFNENLLDFLNLATLICHAGYVPDDMDILMAETHGNWWTREDNTFNIIGQTNNIWVNIREENETEMIVEFNFRYDSKRQKEIAISNTMLAFLEFVEEIKE